MSQLAPPPLPPRVATGDQDNLERLRFRLFQVLVTAVTILLTAWFITMGPVPAILALATAKHVLVAILCMGLDLYPTYRGEKDRPP
jgi:hypothetical protein